MTRPSDEGRCDICGEPMPEGESMFRMHGYSGPCPKLPLPQPKVDTIESLRAERDALAGTLAAARAERNAYREAMAQMNAPAIAMAALRPAPPIIMPAQDWDLHQQIQTLNERIAYLEPIRIAAQELVDNAEEYECDGLGLFAQHGWWEPLHDALGSDGKGGWK